MIFRLHRHPAILALAVLGGSVAACGHGYGSSTTHVRSVIADGNGGYYAVLFERRGDAARFAMYRDGEFQGVDRIDETKLDYVDVDKMVDHPELRAWRDQLAQARMLANQPDTTATDVAEAVSSLPFELARTDVCTDWAGSDAPRNAALLDALAARGDEIRPHPLNLAVASAMNAGGLDDARLAKWARYALECDANDALKHIAAAPLAGPDTAKAIITEIDELLASDRMAVFVAVGARLAGDPIGEELLTKEIDELLASDRLGAAQELLSIPHATPALAMGFLENLDEFLAVDRAAIYVLVARRLAPIPDAHDAIAKEIDELLASDRRSAMLAIITEPTTPDGLVARLVKEIDEVLASDRDEVLAAIVAHRSFADETVQRACIEASSDLLYSDREAMLRRIAEDPRSTRATRDAAWRAR